MFRRAILPILIGSLLILAPPASAQVGAILEGLARAAEELPDALDARDQRKRAEEEHAYRMRMMELELERMEQDLEAAERSARAKAAERADRQGVEPKSTSVETVIFRLKQVAGYDVPMSLSDPETGEVAVEVYGGTIAITGDYTWSGAISVALAAMPEVRDNISAFGTWTLDGNKVILVPNDGSCADTAYVGSGHLTIPSDCDNELEWVWEIR